MFMRVGDVPACSNKGTDIIIYIFSRTLHLSFLLMPYFRNEKLFKDDKKSRLYYAFCPVNYYDNRMGCLQALLRF